MPDFAAILRKAWEHSKNAGDGGATGDAGKSDAEISGLADPHTVTIPEDLVVPVVTPTALNRVPVTTVTTDRAGVVPGGGIKLVDRKQRLSSPVTSGTTVTIEKHDFCKNADAVRRADLRNSPALFEPQLDLNRCYICGGQEEQGRLFIAVLTAKPGAPHWLHADCHEEHVRRLDTRVEAALADDEPAPF